jgi:hypothetical protein
LFFKLNDIPSNEFDSDLCKYLFKKWYNLDEFLFSLERVSGGITNLCMY